MFIFRFTVVRFLTCLIVVPLEICFCFQFTWNAHVNITIRNIRKPNLPIISFILKFSVKSRLSRPAGKLIIFKCNIYDATTHALLLKDNLA